MMPPPGHAKVYAKRAFMTRAGELVHQGGVKWLSGSEAREAERRGDAEVLEERDPYVTRQLPSRDFETRGRR